MEWLGRTWLRSCPTGSTSQWTLAGEQARLAAEHADKAGDEGERARALAFYIGDDRVRPGGRWGR